MAFSLDKIKCKTAEEKPCSVLFDVQVPADLVNREYEKTLALFQKTAQLPGFRSGKAPLEMIRQNFASRARTEAVEELLKEGIPIILQDKKIMAVETPQVQKLQLNEDESLSFTLLVERSPEFKTKNYKGIKLERKGKEISADDIEKDLESLRQRNATLQFSEASNVEKNHFAVIDYEGFIDGKSDTDLKAEHQLIDMNTPQTVAGFAEGIMGMSRNETKEVTVQFPEDYAYKKLAKQTVTFKITLQDIKEKKLPAADDELAKDFGYETLTALKEHIEKSLKSSLEKSVESDLEQQIVDYLDQENPIPVPSGLIDRQADVMVNQFMRSQYGKEMERESKEVVEKRRVELIEKLRPEAEKMVRTSYLLEDIAKQENLYASDEDWAAELEKAKQSDPEKAKDIEKYFKEKRGSILNRLAESKIFKYLKDNAKITETKTEK